MQSKEMPIYYVSTSPELTAGVQVNAYVKIKATALFSFRNYSVWVFRKNNANAIPVVQAGATLTIQFKLLKSGKVLSNLPCLTQVYRMGQQDALYGIDVPPLIDPSETIQISTTLISAAGVAPRYAQISLMGVSIYPL